MKGIPAYSLLVKVARGVFQRWVETTLESSKKWATVSVNYLDQHFSEMKYHEISLALSPSNLPAHIHGINGYFQSRGLSDLGEQDQNEVSRSGNRKFSERHLNKLEGEATFTKDACFCCVSSLLLSWQVQCSISTTKNTYSERYQYQYTLCPGYPWLRKSFLTWRSCTSLWLAWPIVYCHFEMDKTIAIDHGINGHTQNPWRFISPFLSDFSLDRSPPQKAHGPIFDKLPMVESDSKASQFGPDSDGTPLYLSVDPQHSSNLDIPIPSNKAQIWAMLVITSDVIA